MIMWIVGIKVFGPKLAKFLDEGIDVSTNDQTVELFFVLFDCLSYKRG